MFSDITKILLTMCIVMECCISVRVRVMMFDATFNNISVISWQSVLLVEETGETDRPAASH